MGSKNLILHPPPSILRYFTLNPSVSVLFELASVTRTLKYHVPVFVHVPEMTPVVAFSVIPGGIEPPWRFHTALPTTFDAVTW